MQSRSLIRHRPQTGVSSSHFNFLLRQVRLPANQYASESHHTWVFVESIPSCAGSASSLSESEQITNLCVCVNVCVAFVDPPDRPLWTRCMSIVTDRSIGAEKTLTLGYLRSNNDHIG